MDWSTILNILLTELAKELPDLLAYLVNFIKAWLDQRLNPDDKLALFGEPPVGTLEEFTKAVREKLNSLIQRAPVGIRWMLRLVNNRLTAQLIERVYQMVVGNVAPVAFEAAPVTAAIDEALTLACAE